MITNIHFDCLLSKNSKRNPEIIPLPNALNYKDVLNNYHRAKKLVRGKHITIYIEETDKQGFFLPERKSSLKEIKNILKRRLI
jgi:hypothetical protein